MRIIPAAVIFLVSLQVSAQDSALHNASLFFVGLSVKNAHATQQWYVEKLNSRILKPVDSIAPGITFGLLESNGYLIELLSDKSSVSRQSLLPDQHNTISMQGIFKFGFLVSNLNNTIAVLKTKGISPKLGPFDDQFSGTRSFIIEDPDGNLIQFFEKVNK